MRPRGRGARILLSVVVAAMTGAAVIASLMAAADAEVALRGTPATATIVETGAEQRWRRSWVIEARLSVPWPEGTQTVAWAERAVPVQGGSWADPARAPRRGDSVAVLLVPDAPPRIVPADALGGRWSWAATLAFIWLLTAGAWAARLRGRVARPA